MVEIEVDGVTAQIKEGVWTSQDSLLQTQCEVYTLFHPYTPVPSNPDPDYDVAAGSARSWAACSRSPSTRCRRSSVVSVDLHMFFHEAWLLRCSGTLAD